MSLQTLNILREAKDLPVMLLNEAIEAAISDIYSLKLSTTGFNSRSEQIVKLLKSLKNPPEKYSVSD